jgi:hypothetical protein
MNYADKRGHERHQIEAPVVCTFFNTTNSFVAKTFNCGEGGMYLKSKTLLKPGAALCIRCQEFPSNAGCWENCQGLRMMALAEVKWCRELPEANSLYYEFGVKYHESY